MVLCRSIGHFIAKYFHGGVYNFANRKCNLLVSKVASTSIICNFK